VPASPLRQALRVFSFDTLDKKAYARFNAVNLVLHIIVIKLYVRTGKERKIWRKRA
jgi:hypothetical protein